MARAELGCDRQSDALSQAVAPTDRKTAIYWGDHRDGTDGTASGSALYVPRTDNNEGRAGRDVRAKARIGGTTTKSMAGFSHHTARSPATRSTSSRAMHQSVRHARRRSREPLRRRRYR